jgi:hypothetical protein
MLSMLGEPGHDLVGRAGRNEDLAPLDRDPLTYDGSQRLDEIVVGMAPNASGLRQGRPSCATARGEAQSHEDPARLVGREIRAVESRDFTDDLLWRIPASVHDDEVLRNRIGEDSSHAPLDLRASKFEPAPGDCHSSSCCIRHVFSDLSLPA